MKTVMIIPCVLAITAVVYGINVDRLEKLNNNLAKCTEELGGSISKPSAEILRCALDRDGQIFDANGAYLKDAALKGFEDVISDAGKLNQAQSIFTKCYNDAVQKGSTIDKQTLEIAHCTLPTILLLDKLN